MEGPILNPVIAFGLKIASTCFGQEEELTKKKTGVI